MPVQGYTPNKNLAKIAQNSTDNWDVWSNQNLDTLDEPVLIYNIAAAENLNAGDVAVIKDDGTGAKKAYLATTTAYTAGDPLGIALTSATAGSSVRLSLDGRVQNAGWSFGPSDKFVYLSNTGAVTTTPTATKIGFVLSATAIYFTLQAPPGGQTDTVTGANGIQNTGNNVNAILSPVYGSTANTVCQGNDARLHNQNSDLGTSAASFEINYTANSARLLTTGLTANRDYTLPNGTTKLVGESVPATITAQHSFAPAAPQAPFALGANAQGQLVTGLNADKLDGNDSTAFAPAASGVTNGDSHDHAGGDGAQIPLASGVTGTLPVANGGTGQTTANAALNALLPSQTGKKGKVLFTDGANTLWSGIPRRNFIINGNGIVGQRAQLDMTATTAGVYYFGECDRFTGAWTGTACASGILKRYAATPYSAHIFNNVTLTGAGVLYHRTRIESSVARMMKEQSCSFQVSVYQDTGASKNFTLYIRKANAADNFSAVTEIANSGPISVNSGGSALTTLALENVSMADCSNGIEIEVKAEVGAITSKNVYLTDYQAEIGSTISAFAHRLFPEELLLCQRYFLKTFPYATAPAQAAGYPGALFIRNGTGVSGSVAYSWRFPVQMRTTPTITTYNPAVANANWRDSANAADRTVSVAYAGADKVDVYAAATVAASDNYIHVTADAEL